MFHSRQMFLRSGIPSLLVASFFILDRLFLALPEFIEVIQVEMIFQISPCSFNEEINAEGIESFFPDFRFMSKLSDSLSI